MKDCDSERSRLEYEQWSQGSGREHSRDLCSYTRENLVGRMASQRISHRSDTVTPTLEVRLRGGDQGNEIGGL